MAFRTLLLSIAGLILLLSQKGCEEQTSGPQIEWLSTVNQSYSYSGGVLSGVSYYLKFNVVDDQSGELTIEGRIGSSEKSCSAFVEAGEQYTVKAICTLGKEGSSSLLTLDPSSGSEPLEVTIIVKLENSNFSVNLKELQLY